jgi:hypothetical protein
MHPNAADGLKDQFKGELLAGLTGLFEDQIELQEDNSERILAILNFVTLSRKMPWDARQEMIRLMLKKDGPIATSSVMVPTGNSWLHEQTGRFLDRKAEYVADVEYLL